MAKLDTLERGRPAQGRGKSSVYFHSSQGREWRKKNTEIKKNPTWCLLWKQRNTLQMGFWGLTMMLPVLLVRQTKLLKSSLWSSKACGNNNLFQTCPKTAFLFACLRSCFAPACSHWGAEQTCRAAWEMRAWVEAQVSSPKSQGLQRDSKDHQSWLASSFYPTEQQLIPNPDYHILGNSKCVSSVLPWQVFAPVIRMIQRSLIAVQSEALKKQLIVILQ